MNSCASEGLAISATLVPPVVLLLSDTNIISNTYIMSPFADNINGLLKRYNQFLCTSCTCHQ